MKKKILALLLALLLPACSAAEAPAPDAVSSPPDMPTLIWWTVGPEPRDYALGTENINRYLEANMGLRLDMRMLSWQELMEKSQMIVNSGEYFDIMFVDSENYNKFTTLGAFRDITDSLRSAAPDLWEFIPDQVWAGAKIDGRIYAIPTYKDVALAQYWVFDKKAAESCGIDIAATDSWDALDSALTKMKARGGEGFYPVSLTKNETFGGIFNGYDSLCSGLPIVGARVDGPEREAVCLLDEPEVLQRLRFLRKWYTEGIINPDANVTLSLSGPQVFFSGVGWPGAEQVWQRNKGAEAYVSKLIYGPVLSSETIQGSMNAVYSYSGYQTEALGLLERINLDPVLRDMFAYGVEGTHFEYVSDRVVRQLGDGWNVEVFAQGTFFTMSTTTESAPNQWELVKAQNARAKASELLGFSLSVGELSTELSACKAVWDKYKADILTGAVDLGPALAQCKDELRKAGLDIVISEAQKQIRRFVGA
jgi:putative aldouronate transport system substrate-binding protein